MRADQLLVHRGLAPSRSAAQRLIARQAVRWRVAAGAWKPPAKAGELLPPDCELQVTDDAELRYVSRGGLKLAGALDALGIDPAGRHCLDVGQSTGGFTDVLLARGAAHVVGIDVGHGQLHPRLRGDPRVTGLEGVHARDLPTVALPYTHFDLIAADLSFISLRAVLPALAARRAPHGALLLLVKPQFELQPADIGRGGLVKDPAAAAPRVRAALTEACAACGLRVDAFIDSPVRGGDGNHEHFLLARAPAEDGTRTPT